MTTVEELREACENQKLPKWLRDLLFKASNELDAAQRHEAEAVSLYEGMLQQNEEVRKAMEKMAMKKTYE